jgi:hypothetical protein
VELAARWCPDAPARAREAAAARLAFERMDAAGLADEAGISRPAGWPVGDERDLLEACEEILRTQSVAPLRGIVPGSSPHPLGLGEGPVGEGCGNCAWNRRGRCLQTRSPGRPARGVRADWPACARWEPALSGDSCASCGACCRQGYSFAPVKRGEAVRRVHPEWIEGSGRDARLPRPGGLCVALDGNGSEGSPWRCRDYGVRPRACADLEPGTAARLQARRRTGLSR